MADLTGSAPMRVQTTLLVGALRRAGGAVVLSASSDLSVAAARGYAAAATLSAASELSAGAAVTTLPVVAARHTILSARALSSAVRTSVPGSIRRSV